jgi:zinc transporter ZupT
VNLVAILGAGFLLGVALLIILPESVAALAASAPRDNEAISEEMCWQIGLALTSGFMLMLLLNELFPSTGH